MDNILYKKSTWLNTKSLGIDSITCVALADSILSSTGARFRYQIIISTLDGRLCLNFRQTYKTKRFIKAFTNGLEYINTVIKDTKRGTNVCRKKIISDTKDETIYFNVEITPKAIKLCITRCTKLLGDAHLGKTDTVSLYSDIGIIQEFEKKKSKMRIKINTIVVQLKSFCKFLESDL